MISLFGEVNGPVPRDWVNPILAEKHYLGPINRGIAWADEFGVMVLTNPTSRRLPQDRWLEVARWCLYGVKNGGSQQWARVKKWLRQYRTEITTVVSYSDPSVGHTGSLYKACGWNWSPTWHRISPPPTGNGSWTKGKLESVKDRWIYILRDDPERNNLLALPALYQRRLKAGYHIVKT